MLFRAVIVSLGYLWSNLWKAPTLVKLIKDGAHYCYCAHFLRMSRQSRDAKEMRNTQDTRTGFVSCKSVMFQLFLVEKKASFFNRRKIISIYLVSSLKTEEVHCMRMLLFLPYDRSDRTFYSQTEVNSKTSKVIASRCYAQSSGIKKSLNMQGLVNQKENSSKSSA